MRDLAERLNALPGNGLGWSDRRRLAERLAVLRPLASRRVEAPRRVGRSRAWSAFVASLDPLLGIDRTVASDEAMTPFVPVVAGAAAAAAAYVCLNQLLGLPAWISLGTGLAAGVMAGRAVITARRDKILRMMEDQFALALGVIIRCVRAGLPVNEGMRAVSGELPSPTGPEFRRVVDQIQLGAGFEASLAALASRCSLADYRFFAVSVGLQRQTGGNLAETLDNLSETIRKRRAVRLRAQALTSETRATVLVLALLPIVVGGILMVVNPPYVMQLFITESGRRLLGFAVITQMVGLAIIRSLSRRSLS